MLSCYFAFRCLMFGNAIVIIKWLYQIILMTDFGSGISKLLHLGWCALVSSVIQSHDLLRQSHISFQCASRNICVQLMCFHCSLFMSSYSKKIYDYCMHKCTSFLCTFLEFICKICREKQWSKMSGEKLCKLIFPEIPGWHFTFEGIVCCLNE